MHNRTVYFQLNQVVQSNTVKFYIYKHYIIIIIIYYVKERVSFNIFFTAFDIEGFNEGASEYICKKMKIFQLYIFLCYERFGLILYMGFNLYFLTTLLFSNDRELYSSNKLSVQNYPVKYEIWRHASVSPWFVKHHQYMVPCLWIGEDTCNTV